MSTIYIFKLNEDKFYISEFHNDIIKSIDQMIEKLISDKQSDNYKNLFVQNLGTALCNIDWIKKYPIESIVEKIQDSYLEKVFIHYVKQYGIDNVRCDLYKNIIYSEEEYKYLQDILIKSIPDQIKSIDLEINTLKSIFDMITSNNLVIVRYEKYGAVQSLLHQKIHEHMLILQDQRRIKPTDDIIIFKQTKLAEFNGLLQTGKVTINLLLPNFIDTFIKKYKDISHILKPVLKEYFLNSKILEEIANALLLQKKNQQLISKYGKLDNINKKLSDMLYRKIELIHELDDVEIE
jgi:hypothetical protein